MSNFKNKLSKRKRINSKYNIYNKHWVGDWVNYPISNELLRRGIKPSRRIDSDGDLVVDSEDCDPNNPKKQGQGNLPQFPNIPPQRNPFQPSNPNNTVVRNPNSPTGYSDRLGQPVSPSPERVNQDRNNSGRNSGGNRNNNDNLIVTPPSGGSISNPTVITVPIQLPSDVANRMAQNNKSVQENILMQQIAKNKQQEIYNNQANLKQMANGDILDTVNKVYYKPDGTPYGVVTGGKDSRSDIKKWYDRKLTDEAMKEGDGGKYALTKGVVKGGYSVV